MGNVWPFRLMGLALAVATTAALLFSVRTTEPTKPVASPHVVYAKIVPEQCWDRQPHPEGCPGIP